MACKCEFKYKKKRSVKKKLIIALIVIAVAIGGVWAFIALNVNPMIITFSNEKIRSLTSEAVSQAVLNVMANNPNAEYMNVLRNNDNDITGIELDTDKINKLAHEITIEAQSLINAVGQDGIKIPLGSLSGVTLFTGLGPDINIKMYLVGSTQTRIISVFSDSGINQSLHSLYLDIKGNVSVAIPGLPSSIETSTQVLMSETVIVGDVPATYLNATSIGDMLDLIAD